MTEISRSDQAQNSPENDVKQILTEVPDNLLIEVLEARGSAEVVIRKEFMASHHSFSGPLPPPETLSQYKALDPDLLNRIVTMAEKEQSHRHGVEAGIVKSKFGIDSRGQHYALGVSVLLIALASWALHLGHPATAGTIAVTAVIGAIGAFLRKTANKKSDQITDDSSQPLDNHQP